jgi:hypothetical protein
MLNRPDRGDCERVIASPRTGAGVSSVRVLRVPGRQDAGRSAPGAGVRTRFDVSSRARSCSIPASGSMRSGGRAEGGRSVREGGDGLLDRALAHKPCANSCRPLHQSCEPRPRHPPPRRCVIRRPRALTRYSPGGGNEGRRRPRLRGAASPSSRHARLGGGAHPEDRRAHGAGGAPQAIALAVCTRGRYALVRRGALGNPAGRGLRGLGREVNRVPASVPLWAVLLGLGSACSSGLAFGLHPATRASRLAPAQHRKREGSRFRPAQAAWPSRPCPCQPVKRATPKSRVGPPGSTVTKPSPAPLPRLRQVAARVFAEKVPRRRARKSRRQERSADRRAAVRGTDSCTLSKMSASKRVLGPLRI